MRNKVASVAFTVGAEAADVINVALQLRGEGAGGAQGGDVNEPITLDAYISDDVNGATLAAAHSGGAAIGTDGLMIETTANQVFKLTCETDGDVDIDFTEVGAKTAYLIVVLPNGDHAVSGAITHAA